MSPGSRKREEPRAPRWRPPRCPSRACRRTTRGPRRRGSGRGSRGLEVPADTARLDVDDRRGTELQRVGRSLVRHDRLVQAHRCGEALRPGRVVDEVVLLQRLLDEEQVRGVEPLERVGIREGVGGVGIHLQGDGSESRPHGGGVVDVASGLDLDLDADVTPRRGSRRRCRRARAGSRWIPTEPEGTRSFSAPSPRRSCGPGRGAPRRSRRARVRPWPCGARTTGARMPATSSGAKVRRSSRAGARKGSGRSTRPACTRWSSTALAEVTTSPHPRPSGVSAVTMTTSRTVSVPNDVVNGETSGICRTRSSTASRVTGAAEVRGGMRAGYPGRRREGRGLRVGQRDPESPPRRTEPASNGPRAARCVPADERFRTRDPRTDLGGTRPGCSRPGGSPSAGVADSDTSTRAGVPPCLTMFVTASRAARASVESMMAANSSGPVTSARTSCPRPRSLSTSDSSSDSIPPPCC